MGQLEDITNGAAVRGILPDGQVVHIDGRWIGSVAFDFTYNRCIGRLECWDQFNGRKAK